MTDETRSAFVAIPELVLKTTPPGVARNLQARGRLGIEGEKYRDRPVIVVQAPPGFGKTSLLTQWRREIISRGAAVAWLSADGSEDPVRFLQSLVLAIRTGCGRPAFGRLLLSTGMSAISELEGITAWLVEVAQSALPIVLIIDEAERLAKSNLNALVYILHNVPSNLRVVVAGRSGLDDKVADLIDYGHCALLGAEELRFRFDETIALVRERIGTAVGADTCAKLHEITEGWPLGLQLAVASFERGQNPSAAIDAMSGGLRGERERVLQGLLAKLPARDLDFLACISVTDLIHPDLCRVLTGRPDAEVQLAKFLRETPIFMSGDTTEWCRMHALAREGLKVHLAAMLPERQTQLHSLAMKWLSEHGMMEEAARHAHAAGQHQIAFELAAQCLFEAVTQGQLGRVLDWLERMPDSELDHHPRLRLAAAWALALSERHKEAESLVMSLLDKSQVDDELRYECALILSGAAYYADEPDRCLELYRPWIDARPFGDARRSNMHLNRLSLLALLAGAPSRARRYQQSMPQGDQDKAQSYSAKWSEFIIGLSFLWEGQPLLAENTLRPAVLRADAELGRRHPLSSMLAALLAATVYERDKIDEAVSILANRLDVLERAGAPETVIIAYRTLSRIAQAQGADHRSLEMMEALHAVGIERRLPRLCLASLAEQIRMHAGRFRIETCRVLVQRVEDILADDNLPAGPLWRHGVDLLRSISHAHEAIARQDWPAARDALSEAALMAEATKLGQVRIEVMALKALASGRDSEKGRELFKEAITLASVYGLTRTIVDAHPHLADWVRSTVEASVQSVAGAPSLPMPHIKNNRGPKDRADLRALPTMILTPKEREVLELLARNLTNKEIAQAMGVGEETVKWHVKNLLSKLDAGTRRHVVRRAQLLGLLETAE